MTKNLYLEIIVSLNIREVPLALVTNTEIHNYTMRIELETLEHLSFKFLHLPSSLKAKIFMRKNKLKESKIQRGWMTPREKCLPGTTKRMHISTPETLAEHIRHIGSNHMRSHY